MDRPRGEWETVEWFAASCLLLHCLLPFFPVESKRSAASVNYHFKVASFTLSYLLKSNYPSPRPSVQLWTEKRSRKIAEIIKDVCSCVSSALAAENVPDVLELSESHSPGRSPH